jgi:hypothetical protein
MEIARVSMANRSIQVINLHPFRHMDVLFPYMVDDIRVGDNTLFSAEIDSNRVVLLGRSLARAETSMSIRLRDAQRTLLTFLVRTDSMTPMVYQMEFADPRAEHINATEAAIAMRLQDAFERRVLAVTEEQLQQRLLYAGDVLAINRRVTADGDGRDQMALIIETAQVLPDPTGRPQLYIRYTLENRSNAEIHDAMFRVQINRPGSLGRTQRIDVYDVQDRRTSEAIPAARRIRGLLVMEMPILGEEETITLELSAREGRLIAKAEGLLRGLRAPGAPPAGGEAYR